MISPVSDSGQACRSGETGFLVPLAQMTETPFEATHPAQFAHDLAARVNELMADPDLRTRMGKAGHQRAEDIFSWRSIAKQTHALYASLIGAKA